jgi:ABC-type nickel/cobalt efflux system permease component RcnA
MAADLIGSVLGVSAVPVVLATLGVVEIFGGLMMMATVPTVLRVVAGILILGFAMLTFARAAVVYQLERGNLYHGQQTAPGSQHRCTSTTETDGEGGRKRGGYA